MTQKPCSSTRHCLNWGFCHRCHPDLAEAARFVVRAITKAGVPTHDRSIPYGKIMTVLAQASQPTEGPACSENPRCDGECCSPASAPRAFTDMVETATEDETSGPDLPEDIVRASCSDAEIQTELNNLRSELTELREKLGLDQRDRRHLRRMLQEMPSRPNLVTADHAFQSKPCVCRHEPDEHSVYGCDEECPCEWMPTVTVHACPVDGTGITACCGRTPFEMTRARLTRDPTLVTCAKARQSPADD